MLAAMDLGFGAPAPIDVERLVQWTLAPGRSGGLVWRDEAALAFDRGCTAKPRRAVRGNWALAIAGTVRRPPRRVVIEATADGDASAVLAAIRALPSGLAASLVIHHGRWRTRPGWTETVVRHMPHWAAPGRPCIRYAGGTKDRTRPYCPLRIIVEQVVTERAICRYELWWQALAGLHAALDDRLERWRINGFAAPARPWEDSA
jgi:hypothetical protein